LLWRAGGLRVASVSHLFLRCAICGRSRSRLLAWGGVDRFYIARWRKLRDFSIGIRTTLSWLPRRLKSTSSAVGVFLPKRSRSFRTAWRLSYFPHAMLIHHYEISLQRKENF